MNRRKFGLLAGTSVAALKLTSARAQSARNPGLLGTTLTPMGSEPGASADGTIPAWTGGYKTLPAGFQPNGFIPDPFADEAPVVVINASNMAQYSDKLSAGVQAMMQKYGYSIKVYPTHRTACYPDWIYANIKANCTNAQLNPKGGRLGYTGAYGGIPFPIPDVSDPLAAGAEIMWNHQARYPGALATINRATSYAVNNGTPVLSSVSKLYEKYPFYDQNGSLATYKGYDQVAIAFFTKPSTLTGEQALQWIGGDPYVLPTQSWQLLNGQGRVRQAPNLEFDTPSGYNDGISNFDEFEGFLGSQERYDWKYIGKKEMYIPYNNNKAIGLPNLPNLGPHFVSPDAIRWELHRVWVVEATLHPGERNTLARRTFYVDEDSWIMALADGYDASNNIYHSAQNWNYIRPDVPAVIYGQTVMHDLQTGDYTTINGLENEEAHPSLQFLNNLPDNMFTPSEMAASAQY